MEQLVPKQRPYPPIQATILEAIATEVAEHGVDACVPFEEFTDSELNASPLGIEHVIGGRPYNKRRAKFSHNRGVQCTEVGEAVIRGKNQELTTRKEIVINGHARDLVTEGMNLKHAILMRCFYPTSYIEKRGCFHNGNCPIQKAIGFEPETLEKIQNSYRRYVRASSWEYVEQVSGMDDWLLVGDGLKRFFENGITIAINHEYLIAANVSTEYLQNLDWNSVLSNKSDFIKMMQEYSIQGAYMNKKKELGSWEKELIGGFAGTKDGFAKLKYKLSSEYLDEEEIIINGYDINNLHDDDIVPMEDRLDAVRISSQICFQDGSQSHRLNGAIRALFINQRGWTWHNANQSRSCNYFNVLLEKVGLNPISHGVIDFAAHSMNYPEFNRYVRYVIEKVEGQMIVDQ